MVDIKKVLDGAASPVFGAAERIVGNSPGFILTSDGTKGFKDNMKGAVELGKDEAEAGLKDFGIQKVLDIADGIHPALGNLGRSILGRQIEDKTTYPPDPLYAPADSWYTLGRKRRDPAFVFDWDVEMPQVGGLQLPNSYVEEVQVNLPNVEDWNAFRNGTRSYYAGFSDVGTLTMTCYEDNRLSTMTYFATWFGTIQNQTDGTFNPPSKYQKDVKIWVMAPSSSGGKLDRIGYLIAHGIFPKDRQGLNFTSGNSDRHRIQVTFSVNNVSYFPTAPVDAAVAKAAATSLNPETALLGKFLQLISPGNDPSKGVFSLDMTKSPSENMMEKAGAVGKKITGAIF